MFKKDWSSLKKDDKLYLLVPVIEDRVITYIYQESSVINCKEYGSHVNIRFKYSDVTGKRMRIDLCVNKLKYDQKFVNTSKQTGWARDNEITFGDFIVTYENPSKLNDIYRELIDKKIEETNKLIESQRSYLRKLESSKYETIVRHEGYNQYK